MKDSERANQGRTHIRPSPVVNVKLGIPQPWSAAEGPAAVPWKLGSLAAWTLQIFLGRYLRPE